MSDLTVADVRQYATLFTCANVITDQDPIDIAKGSVAVPFIVREQRERHGWLHS